MSIADILRTPRTNVISSILTFPQFDTEGVSKRLRLKELGAERGRDNLPPTGDQLLDSTEQKIVGEVQGVANTQFDQYLQNQQAYADRVSSAGIQGLVVRIGAVTDAAITNFERKTRVGTGDLFALRRDLRDSDRELKEFR